MYLRWCYRKPFNAVLFALLAGCGGLRDGGTPTFLLPAIDADGNERFEKVDLPTLYSPYRVEGSVATIYFNPKTNDNSFSGSAAAPKLNKSGDLFIPMNAESGAALAAYRFFERIHDFEAQVLIRQELTFPRKLGIYKNVRNMSAAMENNAAYMAPPYDEYAILPFDDTSRTAMVFNNVVLGHEHFHAHFHFLVNQKLPELQTLDPMDVAGAYNCPQTDLQYEIILLRSWNEGLADFYGAVTSGTPKLAGLVDPKRGRSILAAPEPMEPRKQFLNFLFTGTCFRSDPYYNAKEIGRVLFAIADRGEFPDVQAKAGIFNKYQRAARYLIYRLQDLPKDLQGKNWYSIESDYVMRYLLKGVPLSIESCSVIHQAVGDSAMKGYGQCAGV